MIGGSRKRDTISKTIIIFSLTTLHLSAQPSEALDNQEVVNAESLSNLPQW